MAFFVVDGKTMPVPSEMAVNNELIWSSDTGRTLSGKMSGSVIAEKMTISLKWKLLSNEEYKKLEASLKAGFFSITLQDVGTKTVYRGTLVRQRIRVRNGLKWADISVDLIER